MPLSASQMIVQVALREVAVLANAALAAVATEQYIGRPSLWAASRRWPARQGHRRERMDE